MVTHVYDNSNLSQEIPAIDTWGAVICSLGHGRKHMLTIFPTIWRPGLKHLRSSKSLILIDWYIVKPGFHNTSNATTMTQKQSDYKVEQSSFTLNTLFSLKIGRCRGRNWLNGNQALSLVSIKPITTTTTTNFELKQSDWREG